MLTRSSGAVPSCIAVAVTLVACWTPPPPYRSPDTGPRPPGYDAGTPVTPMPYCDRAPSPTGVMLPVVPTAQYCSEWCWAACASMVLQYYGRPISECEVVSAMLGGNCCQLPAACATPCNTSGNPIYLLTAGGLYAQQVWGAISPAALATELTNGRPVIVYFNGTSTGGMFAHFIVVSGYTVGPIGTTFRIIDPLNLYQPGASYTAPFVADLTYDQIYYGPDSASPWVATTAHISARPDGCNPAVSPTCSCGPSTPTAVCGNGSCENGESSVNCCADCACPSGLTCSGGTCASPTVCGDGSCGAGESSATCCEDCGCTSGYVCSSGACLPPVVCGDRMCSTSEAAGGCCRDCGCATGSLCQAGGSCAPTGTATMRWTFNHRCGNGERIDFRVFDLDDSLVWPADTSMHYFQDPFQATIWLHDRRTSAGEASRCRTVSRGAWASTAAARARTVATTARRCRWRRT